MLNLADLGMLLITLSGGVFGAAGASVQGTFLNVGAGAAGGLLVGFLVAVVSTKLSYWLMDKESESRTLTVVAFAAYAVLPFISCVGVGILTSWLGGLIAGGRS